MPRSILYTHYHWDVIMVLARIPPIIQGNIASADGKVLKSHEIHKISKGGS